MSASYSVRITIKNFYRNIKNLCISYRTKLGKYAIFYNVAIIGEAAYKLTKEFIESHNDVPWRSIINMRHVIVHGYYQIDALCRTTEEWNKSIV